MTDPRQESQTQTVADGAAEVGREPLRIVHVAQPTTEGVARCVADLTRHQIRHGHEVTVCCPSDGDLSRWALDAGADLEPWQASRSPGPQIVAEARRLNLLFESVGALGQGERAFPIVHLHSAKAGLAGRLVLRGRRPTIFQPHAWSWLAASGPVRAGARNWEKRAARWADRIVCVSEEEVRIGRSEGVEAGYEVVPNGVDLDDYPYASETRKAEARARLDVDDGPLVVCVGRLSPQKGQDVLLDAWPAIAEQASGARLFLVGDGPDRESLESRGIPGVTFTGTRSDAGAWLAAADVVALPSRWEGMSIVMLEAMATGRPVVASDVAGAAEAVGDEAGEVVPPEDPSALATALLKRLEDPALARREGDRARARAERAHSLDAAAEKVERIYRAVLRERGA